MKPLLLNCDIDGVACDHATAVCRHVNESFGLKCHRSDVTSWNHDFGPVTFVDAVKQNYPDPLFIASMPVTEGFHQFLSVVRQFCDVRFASTRRSHCHEATREWVKEHFEGTSVLFCEDKGTLDGEFLIDDNHKDLLAFVANAGGQGLLLRQPWNDNDGIRSQIESRKECHLAPSLDVAAELLQRDLLA